MQVQEDTYSKPKDPKAKSNLFKKESEPVSPTTKTAQEIRSELSNEVSPSSPTSKSPKTVNVLLHANYYYVLRSLYQISAN